MVIIEPVGGLANRMRVIASALSLQKETGCKLNCIWSENLELDAPFNLLFENIGKFPIQNKQNKFRYLKSTKNKNKLKLLISKIINKLIGVDYYINDQDYPNLILINGINKLNIILRNKNIYIKTCEEFGNNLEEFKKFIPISQILKNIYDIVKQFDNNTIGLHIRRTDNLDSIKYSPIELFIDTINLEIIKNKDANFFLCTDDFEVEKELINKFGKRILIYKKEFSRQTITGMQDAVVDLFCLSKTSLIYGSYWSSFSDIASRIGGVPSIILKK